MDTRLSVRTKKNLYGNAAENEQTREIDDLMNIEIKKHRRIRIGDIMQMLMFLRNRLWRYFNFVFCICISCFSMVECCVNMCSKNKKKNKKSCFCFNRSAFERRLLLLKRGERKLEDDLSIEKIVKTLKLLKCAIDTSVLTDTFRRANIKHTRENVIDLDSEVTTSDGEDLSVDEFKHDS